MKVNIKKLDPNAVIPKRMSAGAAGMDIVAAWVKYTDSYIEYGTGLAIQTPVGYGTFLLPRSSISNKTLSLCNSVGLSDPDYLGEIRFRFKRTLGDGEPDYQVGERIGQLVVLPIPEIEFVEVEEFGITTERGQNGFGSTGV